MKGDENMKKYHFIPNTINLELASNLNLSNGEVLNERFYEIQRLYYHGLQLFLNNLIKINEFEQKIINSDLNFVPLADKENNIYHKYSDLNFIFIRNNLHIERLSNEEIGHLISVKDDSDKLLEFIKTTLKKVIYEEFEFINFGPPILEYFRSGQSIVIEIAYDQKTCKTAEEIYNKKDFVEKINEEISELGRANGMTISGVVNYGLFKPENIELNDKPQKVY